MLSPPWQRIKHYANTCGIRLFGDLSFFVAYDSADVWAQPELFQLDERGRMTANTGVPPDYFAAHGQLWGMPHYDWAAIEASGWQWWIERIRRQLDLFDLLRLDHFRGLAAAWYIPACAQHADTGRWAPGPGDNFLEALQEALGPLPLVAEDLGQITPDVRALRDRNGLAGMRVLQFAFGGSASNIHLPHNHIPNAVVYTGTHDNNTLAGWWAHDCDERLREHVENYFGDPSLIPDAMRRAALASVARWAIMPMQDLLGLGATARMNTPGTAAGNWSWRMDSLPNDGELSAHCHALNRLYGRLATE